MFVQANTTALTHIVDVITPLQVLQSHVYHDHHPNCFQNVVCRNGLHYEGTQNCVKIKKSSALCVLNIHCMAEVVKLK